MESFEEIARGFGVLLIFLGLSSPIIIIGLIYYLKKRLEHKQILAAIEKGTPLSELSPPKPVGPLWIMHLTSGIACIIIAAGMFYWFYVQQVDFSSRLVWVPLIFLAIGFLAIGIAWVIRGLLYRKYQPQIQSSDKEQ